MGRSAESLVRQLETSRNWKKANPERHAEIARAYRARNPEKIMAQNRLNYALRKGVLRRAPCEVCGTEQRVHAHHDDYTKPLEVRWLCYKCHKASHPVSDVDKVVKFERATKARLFGEENPNFKLTAKKVELAKTLLWLKVSQDEIANALGVSQNSISRIKLGKRQSGAFPPMD